MTEPFELPDPPVDIDARVPSVRSSWHGWAASTRSELLPGIDLKLIERCM